MSGEDGQREPGLDRLFVSLGRILGDDAHFVGDDEVDEAEPGEALEDDVLELLRLADDERAILGPGEDEDGPRSPPVEDAEAPFGAFSDLAAEAQARPEAGRLGPIGELPAAEVTRAMLEAWIDEHLPGLAERIVREEIARLRRRLAED